MMCLWYGRAPGCVSIGSAASFMNAQPYKQWEVDITYCDEPDLTRAGYGLLVLRHVTLLNPPGSLAQFRSMRGAPVHLRPEMLFLQSTMHARATYYVPESCVFRAAMSPLQHLYRNSDGDIVSEVHARVEAKYASEGTRFRNPNVQVRVLIVVGGLCRAV
jgi:hypothetical protein